MERIQRRTVIPAEQAGRRLDQAAAELLAEFSRSRLKAWIERGDLTLAGRAAAPKTRVRAGEELRLDTALEPAVELEPQAIALRIVYEDAACVVVDKPANLLVHPGAGHPSGTLQNALLHRDAELARLPRAGIVHRLDKDTSGLLVVARTLDAHKVLVERLQRREIQRTYEGICQRVLTGGGEMDAPLGRHPTDRVRRAVVAGGVRRSPLPGARALPGPYPCAHRAQHGPHASDPRALRALSRAPGGRPALRRPRPTAQGA